MMESFAIAVLKRSGRSDRLASLCAQAARVLVRSAACCAFGAYVGAVAAADAPVLERPIEISVEWRSNESLKWDGELSIEGGTIVAFDGDRFEKDDRLEQRKGSLWWKSFTGPATDGFNATLRASRGAVLHLRTDKMSHDIPLRDLMEGEKVYRGAEGTLLRIGRTPSSALEIANPNDEYIAETGADWRLNWAVDYGFASAPTAPRLQATLEDASGSVVARAAGDLQGRSEHSAHGEVRFVMPAHEGAYTARLRVDGSAIPERTVQVLVLARAGQLRQTGRADAAVEGWTRVDGFRAGENQEELRMRDDGRSELTSEDGIEYRASGTHANPTSKKDGPKDNLAWFGYRINIANPGKAHVVDIWYPEGSERRFVVSLVERKGKAVGRNLFDVGIYTGARSGPAKLARKRILFWPTTRDVTIAVVNTLDGSSAAVSSVEVFEVADGRLGVAAQTTPGERGGYLEDPHLTRLFGGQLAEDTGPGWRSNPKMDWDTYYTTIAHLCEYMKYRGYKELVLPVYTYGTALYPSRVLPSTSRYDDGGAFRDGRHPVQKDIVKLMLELFDRHGLTLIPVFAFYTEIPALEGQEAGPASEPSLYMTYKNGQVASRVLRFRDSASVGPRYNPLNPRVQAVVRDAVNEFVGRYGEYRSLGDVALQLNTTGWLQYPGLSWGYDPGTVRAYFADRGRTGDVALESLDAAEQYELLVSDEYRDDWSAWRNEKIGDLFAAIAADVDRAGGRDLILAYMNIFSSRFGEDREFLKNKRLDVDPHDLLSRKGVDPLAFSGIQGLRIFRPVRVAPPGHDRAQRASSVSAGHEAYELFRAAGASGELHFLHYFETRAHGLSEGWWWPVNYRMVATFDVPLSDRAADRIDGTVYEGGWMLPQ